MIKMSRLKKTIHILQILIQIYIDIKISQIEMGLGNAKLSSFEAGGWMMMIYLPIKLFGVFSAPFY